MYGVEIEAKAKLREMVRWAPDLDLRSSLTRNWSVVDNVTGPGNRVGLQPPLTAGVCADYRLAATPMTVGAAFNLENGGIGRLSSVQSGQPNTKPKLDVYGLDQVSKGTQLRLTMTNILRPKDIVDTIYDDGFLLQERLLRATSNRTVRIQFEMKL